MAMMDWETLLKGKTVDRQWQAFKEPLDELQKLCIPVWRKSGKEIVVKPWLTREIRDSIRFKEKAYKLARKSNRPEDWQQFKIQQRRTERLIEKGK